MGSLKSPPRALSTSHISGVLEWGGGRCPSSRALVAGEGGLEKTIGRDQRRGQPGVGSLCTRSLVKHVLGEQ